MNTRWMCMYGAVLALLSMGCFYSLGDPVYEDDYSYEDDYYSDDDYYADEDGYHGNEAVRQALTSTAPEVSGPGYDSDAWDYDSCEVHAECGPGSVCASDPVCPDYLYCYPKAEAECDCADRFNTVCWFGECVVRGVDCAGGCPSGSVCQEELGACVDTSFEPAPEPDGDKCLTHADCGDGTCYDGACVAQ